jgi:hypothetical protein
MNNFDDLCNHLNTLTDIIWFSFDEDGIFIAQPARACGGLFIHVGGEISPAQRFEVSRLVNKGYQVEVELSIDEAKAAIEKYLS